MFLYVIRHGEPDYKNDTLTPKGFLQAKALAKRLAVHGLDEIYTSPLVRAMHTAKETCDLLGLNYTIEPWTSEAKAYKYFAGKMPNGSIDWVFSQQTTVLRNDKTVHLGERWHEAECFSMIDGKKGFDELIANSDEFLLKLGYKRKGCIYQVTEPNKKKIALFAHAGFGSVWMSHLLQIPLHIFWSSFRIPHSGFAVFQFSNNADGLTVPECLCFSDTSHIYKDGLPLKYNNAIYF